MKEAADRARRELHAQASDAGGFDASRYFRTSESLGFLNVRTPIVRQLGKAIAREHRGDWTVKDATALADVLIRDRHLEIKGVGIEALACFRRQFSAGLLQTVRGWLAADHAANWATTDSICGSLLSPLLQAHPVLVSRVASWTSHRNLWVRRASAVSLVRLAARGIALDEAYGVADRLRDDPHDLIHKAAGWLLREAGRTDRARLRRYLLEHGQSIPRTTIRYAIEHFTADARAELLAATRSGHGRAGRDGKKTTTSRARRLR